MSLTDLKPKVQRSVLLTILNNLVTHNECLSEEDVESLLSILEPELDDLGCNDTFGTEGWKHAFGLED